MSRILFICLLGFIFVNKIEAAVYKCTDPITNKVGYSDKPCSRHQDEKQLDKKVAQASQNKVRKEGLGSFLAELPKGIIVGKTNIKDVGICKKMSKNSKKQYTCSDNGSNSSFTVGLDEHGVVKKSFSVK
jgi:hypothetical protein